ncbi:MAG TPA: response regulator [bacterium]|nr:response regulator [bacterium]HOL47953.1 response regulator [bacterium]HPQ19300.1 response regulator [bacterium]
MFSRILIIDDSYFQRQFVKKFVSPYYSVFTATNGDEGLNILQTEKIDLLIVDNILEKETGYDICKKIRLIPEFSFLPIIMVSGMDKPADIKLGFESGINAYLTKPYQIEDLLKMIRDFESKGVSIKDEKILIIDDSPMIRAIITRALHTMGYKTIEAESGEKALDLLKHEQINLITCDIEMPGINGFETIRRIKENKNLENIPIIMITSKNTKEDVDNAFHLGITEYFIKPFKPETLAEHIEKILINQKHTREETILIADDSELVLKNLENVLKAEGYKVLTAKDGEIALNIILQNPSTINFVICDIYMPKLSGLRLLEKLKEEFKIYPLPPFIFVSAADDRLAAIKALKAGAVDFLKKPFDVVELKLKIANHLTLIRSLNEKKN